MFEVCVSVFSVVCLFIKKSLYSVIKRGQCQSTTLFIESDSISLTQPEWHIKVRHHKLTKENRKTFIK